jgi:hypothetical protein
LKKAKTLANLGRALGFPYQRIMRAKRNGLLKPSAGGIYDVEACRQAIQSHATTVSGGLPSKEKRTLLKVKIRKMRAEADLLESKVKAQSGGEGMLPMLTVRKAWIACESSWVQQCRTIARQAGANWGGKLGREIEALLVKLFNEMFHKMAADRILRGSGKGSTPTNSGVQPS